MGDPLLLCEASQADLGEQEKLRVLHLKQAGAGSLGEKRRPPPAGVVHEPGLLAGSGVWLLRAGAWSKVQNGRIWALGHQGQ